jgi:SNF2 family DNA or RNA helicase
MRDHPQDYIFENTTVADLNYSEILKHSAETVEGYRRGLTNIQPVNIEVNCGVFENVNTLTDFPPVAVTQVGSSLLLSCACRAVKRRMCKHQAEVLSHVVERPEFRIFFDAHLRHEKLKQAASEYGLENEADLDLYFEVTYALNRLIVTPKSKELVAFGEAATELLQTSLLPQKSKPTDVGETENTRTILIFRRHKYYTDQFHIELYEAQMTNAGKIKAPLTLRDPNYLIWKTEDIHAAKFYIAINKWQNTGGVRNVEANIDVLSAITKNPLKLETFWHNPAGSDKLTVNTLEPVLLQNLPMDVKVTVTEKAQFYELTATLQAHNKPHKLSAIELKFEYFIPFGNTLNLVADAAVLRVIAFFKKHDHKLLLHRSKFAAFRKEILTPLERQVEIEYPHIPLASKTQLFQQRFDAVKEKLLYLSEEGNFVALTPVMRYGNVEIPTFSHQQIYDIDARGNEFRVQRDQEMEIKFTATLMQLHPDFPEQLHESQHFYLHKSKFLDENWFLEAFESLRQEGIAVLGFNALKKNKLNMNKGKVTVKVSTDTDWFNVGVKVEYGKQKASLKQIQKSIKNKTKYVQLDDGTLGILPEEWMQKFADYFQKGDVLDDLIRTPKSRFSEINELFSEEVLDVEARNEIHFYIDKFANFSGINAVQVPDELQATLRTYQHQGLNWLNFLDDYNFGGCLADDMGLGKTIQVLALILLQKKKRQQNTNLIIVPTSLLFNWQAEVAKFAPSLRIFTNYGATKIKEIAQFEDYEIILTTYGMLQADVQFLKQFSFNYIILDESQAIKNPDSQRYKAARLLRSRNKLVLTGTPFENNTFDIYGQLSFACPGLLGSHDNFKFLYSNPIERFDDHRRMMALKKIISPFILRRSKQQVAQELPEKTEMVIYCEMGPAQRQVYDALEKELRDYVNAKKGSDEKKEALDSMHILTSLTKLRQICNSPLLLKGEKVQETPSAKIDMLMDQLEQQTPHHKILVFSQFVEMLDLIKKELDTKEIRYEYLTGQTRNRAARVHNFQNDPGVRVFLISLKAGGTGLNLTEADYVYLVDPWWNPAVENQAIDRSHRIGQQNHVVAVKLICPGTVEEKIMKLQDAKTRMSDSLIQSDGEILRSLSRAELLEMLR